jgi:hypothetical protein
MLKPIQVSVLAIMAAFLAVPALAEDGAAKANTKAEVKAEAKTDAKTDTKSEDKSAAKTNVEADSQSELTTPDLKLNEKAAKVGEAKSKTDAKAKTTVKGQSEQAKEHAVDAKAAGAAKADTAKEAGNNDQGANESAKEAGNNSQGIGLGVDLKGGVTVE